MEAMGRPVNPCCEISLRSIAVRKPHRGAYNRLRHPLLLFLHQFLNGSEGFDHVAGIIDHTHLIPGKLVLRRIGDVAGSTPSQREWRIERFNLK